MSEVLITHPSVESSQVTDQWPLWLLIHVGFYTIWIISISYLSLYCWLLHYTKSTLLVEVDAAIWGLRLSTTCCFWLLRVHHRSEHQSMEVWLCTAEVMNINRSLCTVVDNWQQHGDIRRCQRTPCVISAALDNPLQNHKTWGGGVWHTSPSTL